MKTLPYIALLISFFSQAQIDTNTPADALPNYLNENTNWVLDFSDEFNDTNLDLSKWTTQESTKSRAPRPNLSITDWWWKNENVSLNSGNLVLKVQKHDANTMHCGSINSRGKYESAYGYIEARIKIADATKGTHTALWMQGNNMGNIDGTGMDGAEIDVFESAWVNDFTKSVVHIDGYAAKHQSNTKRFNTPGIHNGYHTWGLHWTPDFMKIYYDGKLMTTYASPLWIPQVKEYLWLSNGASFGFAPGSNNFTNQPTGFLTNAYVDYIRVWKEDNPSNSTGCNTVYNSDFENTSKQDFVWRKNNENIKLEETTNPVVTGSKYAFLDGRDVNRFIHQDVVVEPGLTYNFSFLGRIQNENGGSGIYANNHATKGRATLKGEILNGNNTLLSIATSSRSNTSVEGSVLIPEGVRVVRVKMSKNWNIAFIDKIELTASNSLKCTTLSNGFNQPNNFTDNAITIYPNPVHNTTKISGIKSNYNITLTDISGRTLRKYAPLNQTLNIDLNAYPTGLYLLHFSNRIDNISFSKKLIKH